MTQDPSEVPIESIPKSNSLNDSKNNSENKNTEASQRSPSSKSSSQFENPNLSPKTGEGTLNFVHPSYDPNKAGAACQNDVNPPSDQPHESASNRKDELFMNPRNPNFMMSQRFGMGGAGSNIGMGPPQTGMGGYGSMGRGQIYNPNMMQNYGRFRNKGRMSFSGMQPYNPHNPMMSGSMQPPQAMHMGNSYALPPQNSGLIGGYDPYGCADYSGGMPNRMSYYSSGYCQSPYLNITPYNSPFIRNQNGMMNGNIAGGNMTGYNLGMNYNNRFWGPNNRGYAVNRFHGGFRSNGMLFEGNEKVDSSKTINAPKEEQGRSDLKERNTN